MKAVLCDRCGKKIRNIYGEDDGLDTVYELRLRKSLFQSGENVTVESDLCEDCAKELKTFLNYFVDNKSFVFIKVKEPDDEN